jgi:hypothetical protein
MEKTKETFTFLKENLQMEKKNGMKQQENQNQSKRQFEGGDWVFFRLQYYKQSTLKQKKNQKLAPKFYRPYKIIHKIGQVAYELYFPSRIHKVSHVSSLKRVLGQIMSLQIELPELDYEGNLIIKPEKFIDRLYISMWNRTIVEYLIKWKNMPLEETTWENE